MDQGPGVLQPRGVRRSRRPSQVFEVMSSLFDRPVRSELCVACLCSAQPEDLAGRRLFLDIVIFAGGMECRQAPLSSSSGRHGWDVWSVFVP